MLTDDSIKKAASKHIFTVDAPIEVKAARPNRDDSVFEREVLRGLTSDPKYLPCKYFYDHRGSQLFDRICELDEYYLTRTELTIMRHHVWQMADQIGTQSVVIEFGSGSGVKTRLLLRACEPSAYVPVDISRETLMRSAESLEKEFPSVAIVPVHADFSNPIELPVLPSANRRVVYFPGSTIGNFAPDQATALLGHIAQIAGADGRLLIGIDRKKDVAILEAAYNDRLGVTAQFNRNLLERMNRELDADADVTQFSHRAFYNAGEGRIEMHLVSKVAQTIRVGQRQFAFAPGETIHTENSYKYDLDEFSQIAYQAGFYQTQTWTDDARLFAVQFFERR